MEESRRETLKLHLCKDESPPMQAIRLSTTLMSHVLANQKYRSAHQGVSRSVHKIDLHIVVDHRWVLDHRARSVWSQCFEILREYRRDLVELFGLTGLFANSVFGRLTITPTFAENFRTFFNDGKDTLSLFESVCLRLHPEDHCWLDRLHDHIPQHGLVHIELCRCTVGYRDLERLVLHTPGLKTLSLEEVKMEDDPPRRQASNAFENEGLIPSITLTIPLFYWEQPLAAYWRVVEALPQIDELRLTTSGLLGMPEIQSNLSRINKPIKRICLRVAHYPGRDFHHEFLQLQTCLASMQNLVGFHMKIDIGVVDIGEDALSQLELSSRNILSTWALSPGCRLTSITFPFDCSPNDVLGTWEAQLASTWEAQLASQRGEEGEEAAQVDTNTKTQLRRLDFYSCYRGANPSSRLPTLLAFLKTHFPYVYYIGVGASYLEEESHRAPRNGNVDTSALPSHILFQLEKNRVGLTLLDNRVDPPVPRGVWSHILANALAPPPTTSKASSVKVPWSGIYCLVKELAERELLFVSPPAAMAAADPIPAEGRPSKQQRTI